ncbi:hypothetical protein RFI_12646 [Reticulomyxa filosa]|uniref:Heat shock protein 70 n=1 Tax=Reticulomyxa filosa TaxID=46433 RepID=X6NF27_RETFI|nr:hypothetical protein RFI_12646 [Reticulomyxa filosa]|eukprot:ETO24508.1 hypothetical protein RFI_12646 [Reticulomyxa filosa]
MIIDLGGGTADIVSYEVLKEFQVKELVYPSGGPWGSSVIDEEFESILKNLFGSEVMTEFQKSYPAHYVELFKEFEKSKTTFFKQKTLTGKTIEQLRRQNHNVTLPTEFIDFLDEKFGDELPDKVEAFELLGTQRFTPFFFFFFFFLIFF